MLVKSTYNGVTALGSGTSSLGTTITAVVPAKTTLEWTGCGTANYTGAVTLTDSTTVTVDLVDNAGIRKVAWKVVEYY